MQPDVLLGAILALFDQHVIHFSLLTAHTTLRLLTNDPCQIVI
jgi:hypothetical protein